MKPPIKLFLPDDATRVEIKELIPGCTEEMIRTVLEQEYITTGIRWDRIARVVKTVNTTGEVLRNVVVATVDDTDISVHCAKNGPIITGEAIERLRHDLSAIATAIRNNDTEQQLCNGIFVKANDIILTVTTAAESLNVYGIKLLTRQKPDPFPKERCIALKLIPEGYQLIALGTGYVIINEQGAFDIADPFVASDDKLVLFCYVIPTLYGREAFIDTITGSAPPSASNTVTHVGCPEDFPDADHLVKFELRRGKQPLAGRPGSIRFLVGPDDDLQQTGNYRIDHRENNRFKEIPGGTVLAERIPMRQSVAGVDVFGEPIEIPKVNDIIFSYGNGVVEECSPDLVRYIAKEHGVLELSARFLNIAPELVINGNVDTQTGNIKYSRSVLIQGNITPGFRVECDTLKVMDCIEDGVEVICSGDLFVGKGILGERTKVSVSGNAKAGFIQAATLRVSGDCTINEYAYHSTIFCAKKLMIDGKGITSGEKGGIIGGTISSLQQMELHSVGSCSTLTTLCCGFDAEGFSVLMETINLEKTLKKKIVLLQNNLQFNPSSKDRMLQKVQGYPAEKKEAIKTKLLELRQTIEQVEKTDATVALLSRKVISTDIAHSTIFIRHHCIAPVLVEFPQHKRKLLRDASGVLFRLIDDEIAMYEGMHEIDDVPPPPL
jgi:uncharacterized protein (DUF342 family)